MLREPFAESQFDGRLMGFLGVKPKAESRNSNETRIPKSEFVMGRFPNELPPIAHVALDLRNLDLQRKRAERGHSCPQQRRRTRSPRKFVEQREQS